VPFFLVPPLKGAAIPGTVELSGGDDLASTAASVGRLATKMLDFLFILLSEICSRYKHNTDVLCSRTIKASKNRWSTTIDVRT